MKKEQEQKDDGRIIRKDWAAFCTYHCPHPNRPCKKDPCREFQEKFGTKYA
jgi:hypothetical protein|nr:MAG TPA: hypothetical protein [Caudoviricetes sp.]